MEIGIVGTGNIGGTLARRLKAAGHAVRVANSKGPEGVQPFANEIGARAVDVKGAIRGVDAIMLAIALPAMAKLPPRLFDSVPAHVPVIVALRPSPIQAPSDRNGKHVRPILFNGNRGFTCVWHPPSTARPHTAQARA